MNTTYDYEMLMNGINAYTDGTAKVVKTTSNKRELVAECDNGMTYVWDGMDVTEMYTED